MASVRRAIREGFPFGDDVAYCFPPVPFAASTGHLDVLLAMEKLPKDLP